MPNKSCEDCRRLLADHENSDKLADLLEMQFPSCECEQFAVGQGSPGRIGDDEALHRIIVSPRDYDPVAKHIHARPFEKAFLNGLSVCRDCASNEDVRALVEEGLSHASDSEPRQVWAVCEAIAGQIRGMRDVDEKRLFCVYDQTVERANDENVAVPTHASIFQRLPPRGVENRKKLQKDYAGRLREKFMASVLKVEELRDGLFVELNRRAKSGEFRSG